MNKKAYSIKDLMPLGLLIVVSVIAVSIGADVVDTVQEGQITGAAGCNSTITSACGYAFNASESGLSGLDELGSWYPTIGLVLAASVVIGVLVYSFAMRD